jgi:dihydropteroate synthase
MIQILKGRKPEEIIQIMRDIGVDSYGIKIMLPKAMSHLMRIDSLSGIAANILKQEMLSIGADAAVARGCLTGKVSSSGCLLMGTSSQFVRLSEKLRRQPFGLNRIARDLSLSIANYQRNKFILHLGRFKLSLAKPRIMGIVNLTPDSFSGDGLISKQQTAGGRRQMNRILEYAQGLIQDGADIIDVGAESTRPGAPAVPLKEELLRAIPAIRALAKKIKAPISIDTYKPEVARAALDNGAAMINDITGLKDSRMLKVALKYKAAVVIMHMQGRPRTMQRNPQYKSLIGEIIYFLEERIRRARDAGIGEEKIIIDPGIGFGKTCDHNLEILRYLRDFKVLGRPILVGTSRKSFIGHILKAEPQQRVAGTLASCLAAAKHGAKVFRVHDVRQVKEGLKVFQRIEQV